MKRFIIFLIAGFLISTAAFAQPDIVWDRTYGGIGDDFCYAMDTTADGGYILAGSTPSFVTGYSEMWLVKTDSNGDTLWSRTFGRGWGDEARAVQQTIDGGYILAGFTITSEWGYGNMWLVKTDANGDSLWSHTFGDSLDARAYAVQQTSDGGYVLAGTYGVGSRLLKTDVNGDSLWSRTFGDSLSFVMWEEGHAVQQTADGGYILAGTFFQRIWWFQTAEMFLVRTDANGDTLWRHAYGSTGSDNCNAVITAADGGYVLAGSSFTDAGGTDMYLVKTDGNGDTLWTHTYGGSGYDQANSVFQTSDGGYVLAGSKDNDFCVVKTNADGDSLWTNAYGGMNDEQAFSVRQTEDGDYVTAGSANSFGSGDYDMWLVRLRTLPVHVTFPNGNEEWPARSTQTVTWVSDSVDGLMRIELNRHYPDGDWEILADNTPDDNAETVSVTGAYSDQCRVRISLIGDTASDVSNADFSIINPLQMVVPNGNEQWPWLFVQTVTWIGSGVDGLVRLDLNRNYPDGTWELLVDSTANDDAEAVLVTSPFSTACRLRVSLIGDTVSDISDENFSIVFGTTAGELRLVYPQSPDVPLVYWWAGQHQAPDTFSETFRYKNFGSAILAVLPALEPVSDEFSVASPCSILTLAPGEMSDCEVTLSYHPQEAGQDRDTLLLPTNAENQVDGYVRIALQGELLWSGAAKTPDLPTVYALHAAYPNPFNATAELRFDLPRPGYTSLRVYDLLGREVAVLKNGMLEAGSHHVTFDGSGLASGIYFARLEAGKFVQTKKLMLLK